MSKRRTSRGKSTPRKRVLVVTGSRAEFGLLRPVMEAIQKNRRLELRVAVAGEHLLGPANTWREVARDFKIDAKVPMQRARDRGRVDHAAACGRGMTGFAAAYRKIKPDWVVVLGDRIEAFAAASAASIGGIAVCHIHGGDRAEGIADEAMRHAISKLAHLHCAATELSAERLRKLGEKPEQVVATGSPAIDDCCGARPIDDKDFAALGEPRAVVILHPWGGTARQTQQTTKEMALLLLLLCGSGGKSHVLWLMPNHDPGFEHVVGVLRETGLVGRGGLPDRLTRPLLLSLFKRMATSRPRGILVGNSSAGLIEAAAIGLPVVNIGDRQAGRERANNVIDVPVDPPGAEFDEVFGFAAERALRTRVAPSMLFGDGRAGPRIAALLAKIDPHDPALLRKRNSY